MTERNSGNRETMGTTRVTTQGRRPQIHVDGLSPYTIGVLLSLFIGLTLWSSELVGDEVFVLFAFTRELADSPSLVWDWAWRSSWGGASTGRFTSPITHVISNFGVLLTGLTSEFLGIGLLNAYSLWRTLLICATTLASIALVGELTSTSTTAPERRLTMQLAAFVVPLLTIANFSFSATRVTIWSYSIIFLCTLLLVTVNLRIPRIAANTKRFGFRIDLIAAVIVGLLFGTSYELTQAFVPIALLTSWLTTENQDHENGRFVRLIRRLWSPYLVCFAFSALVSTMSIRLFGYFMCSRIGCYAAASIEPSSDFWSSLLATFLSAVPPLPQMWYLTVGGSIGAFDIVVLIIFGATACWLGRVFVRIGQEADGDSLRRTANRLLVVGASTWLVVAVGLASTKEISGNVEELWTTLGRSGRGTLYQNFGSALVVGGVLLQLIVMKVRYKLLTTVFRNLGFFVFGVLGALTVLSNAHESALATTRPQVVFQALASEELRTFDSTTLGDRRRCDLLSNKLKNLAEWRGHDGSLVYGLNLWASRKYRAPFCSISASALFENYYEDPTTP